MVSEDYDSAYVVLGKAASHPLGTRYLFLETAEHVATYNPIALL